MRPNKALQARRFARCARSARPERRRWSAERNMYLKHSSGIVEKETAAAQCKAFTVLAMAESRSQFPFGIDCAPTTRSTRRPRASRSAARERGRWASQMRIAAIVALVAAVSACIPVMDWKSVPLDQRYQTEKDLIIVPGDRVRVHAQNGNVYIFKVTQTDARGFRGVARDDKTYRMEYDNLDAMEVLRGEMVNVASPDWGRLAIP